MPPVHIQVAFQGGGAKLCDLLAAAEAIQKLEKRGEIKVTRVAGTSAGAIVACLYATGHDVIFARQRLRDNGVSFVKRVLPPRTRIGVLWQLFWGKPIYKEDELRKVLAELFKINGSEYNSFADLKIPVMITTADIMNGSKKVYDTPSERIVDALADSAGLPFVFRNAYSGNGRFVDGGICEVLPAEDLIHGEAELGRVVAVSFHRHDVPQMPQNDFQYCRALLDTAISHSMDRTCDRLPVGNVHKIKTEIGTFDFVKALKIGLADDHYLRVMQDAKGWLEETIREWKKLESQSAKSFIPPPSREPSPHDLMRSILEVYKRAHHATPISVKRSSLVVIANGLLPATDPRANIPDEVKQRVDLTPVEKPVGCFRIGMLSGGESPVQGEVTATVRSARKDSVEVTMIPISLPAEESKASRQLLFFFHPDLDPCDTEAHPYTLTLQEQIRGSLCQLAQEGGEEIVALTSDRSENTEIVDIVLFLPKAYGSVHLSDEAQSEIVNIPGRIMSNSELAEYGEPPPGFVAIGWRGFDVKVRQRFAVKLKMNSAVAGNAAPPRVVTRST